MMNCCGLINAEKQPVPLKSIEVDLEVRDHVATVASTLQYDNKEDKPIEAVFVFPMPDEAAVCHFSAKIGQTLVVAEVKEKQKAREEYDDALSSGQQAFLLAESDQTPDIFSLNVGSLPPGESASIRLEYVTELAVQADDGLRFCLPAVLNPRYQPQGSESGSVQVTSIPASIVPYGLSFCARVRSPRPILKVDSNCSLDPLEYLNPEQTQATLKLAQGHKFDRDVELLIYYKDSHQPSALVEAGQASAEAGTLMGDPVVMLSLYPEFPQAVMSSLASCGEFVFLLDRSGSMDCSMGHGKHDLSRISSARDTLLLLLKSLPMGCYFNIYSFGSSYEHIFPKSVEYNQKTMEEALKKVNMMEANLGGTEILQPLKHIYDQPCIPNQPRQLFVFTDGEVGNTKQVTNLVKTNSGSHRCFSFGIGQGASSALINGLAKEGGGHPQFITGNERMQPKVMQSLRFALQPAVSDTSVTWDLPKNMSVTLLSSPIRTIFQGQRALIYAQLTGQSSESDEGCVTVKYSLAGHPSENKLRFSLKPAEDTGLTAHRLGARTLIRSMEMEENKQDEAVKKKIVDVSVQSGVSSSFTAFIAVNKSNEMPIKGPLLRRNIPAPVMMSYNMPLGPVMMGCSMPMAPKMKKCHPVWMSCSMSMAPRMKKCHPGQAKCNDRPKDKLRRCKRSLTASSRSQQALDEDATFDMSSSPGEAFGILDTDEFHCNTMGQVRPRMPPTDPFLKVVSLQLASGCWELHTALADALSKKSKDMEKKKPASVNKEVWATILALIWLHGFQLDAKDEWELLATKAVSWLRSQNVSCIPKCVDAANALLGCKVQKDALGL